MAKPTTYALMQSTLVSAGDELYHLVKRHRAAVDRELSAAGIVDSAELKEIDSATVAWEDATAKARPPVMADKLPEADAVRIDVRKASTAPDPDAATQEILERMQRTQERVQITK